MTLRNKYILLQVVLFVLIGSLAYLLLKDDIYWFFAVEIFIMILAYFSYKVYLAILHPLKIISAGTESLAEGDFSLKFATTKSAELNRLVEIYNDMIDNIRKERRSLAEQHFFLEKIIDASPNGILILDFDNNVERANPKAEEMLGVVFNNIYTITEAKTELIKCHNRNSYRAFK